MKKEDNDKLEWLLKKHEQPEQLSDEDIQNVLDSADMAADISTLSTIKRAMTASRAELSDDEIESQWKSFEAKMATRKERERKSAHYSWMKIAAMFVGVVMIAGVAFAAIDYMVRTSKAVSPSADIAQNAKENNSALRGNDVATADTLSVVQDEKDNIVEFDDVELHGILTAMADYYKLKLKYENEQSKHIKMFFKWNKQSDIASIVELLNSYDRINIVLEGNTLTVK